MKRIFRLALTILVIVLLVRWCKSNDVVSEGKQTAVEIFNHTIDTPIEKTEPSEDPYDKLYAIEDENPVAGKTLREIGAESWKEVKESMEIE